MPKIEIKVVISNKQGLHARPAAIFVQAANRFSSSVIVRKGELEVDGKSIMGILMLAAEEGTELTLVADGEDAESMLQVLKRILVEDEGT